MITRLLLILLLTPIGSSAALDWTSCTLDGGRGNDLSAECTTFTVPENPDQNEGRTIDLNIARIPARSAEPAPDPVFFFAGGPGQSAVESYPQVAAAFNELRDDRDIILVDQRGTGASNPMHCPMPEDEALWEATAEAARQRAEDCLETLDADPRFYTTTVAMSDIDQVREALGAGQINLVGVSYGTRAAQTYLKYYPEHVRTITLDSIVPQQEPLGSAHARNLDQGMYRILNACEASPDCSEAFGEITATLAQLREQIGENTFDLQVASPRTGEIIDVPFDRNVLAMALRLLAYDPSTQSILPLLIHEAQTKQRYDRIAAQALLVMDNLSDQLAHGMELSVICTEDEPFYPEDRSADTGTLIGPLFVQFLQAECSVWPRGERPADFHEPLDTEVPALLLSGELDPVTPPEFGDIAARQYHNGLHLVLPGQAHSVIRRGCGSDLMTRFIEAAAVQDLDSSCLEQLGPTPFFVNLLGPTP